MLQMIFKFICQLGVGSHVCYVQGLKIYYQKSFSPASYWNGGPNISSITHQHDSGLISSKNGDAVLFFKAAEYNTTSVPHSTEPNVEGIVLSVAKDGEAVPK